MVMLKGQSPKVKANICNIPIAEIESNCKSLPRPADSNRIAVKLKRKNEFREHILFEPVRPRIIEGFLIKLFKIKQSSLHKYQNCFGKFTNRVCKF